MTDPEILRDREEQCRAFSATLDKLYRYLGEFTTLSFDALDRDAVKKYADRIWERSP